MRCAGCVVLSSWVLLAPVGSRAGAEELRIEIEGYGFGVRDMRVEPNILVFVSRPSEAPPPVPPDPFELEGFGVRIHGAVDLPGRRGRFETSYQKVQDSDAFAKSVSLIRYSGTARTTLSALDLGWSGVLAQQERWNLRGQVGYRYLNADQEINTVTLLHESIPSSSRFDLDSDIDGHGLRAGTELSVALGGPLQVVAGSGFALLRAAETGRQVSSFEFEPGQVQLNEEAIDEDSLSLSTWDLSVRLRAELWDRVSASIGYRFDRWESAARIFSDADLAFDGVTFGLGYRFGI